MNGSGSRRIWFGIALIFILVSGVAWFSLSDTVQGRDSGGGGQKPSVLSPFISPRQAAAEPGRQGPSNQQLKQWMAPPVLQTLKTLDYIRVDDSSYQKAVFKRDRPVMVLFFADSEGAGNCGGQRGLAALAKALKQRFPEIRLCAYKIADAGHISYRQLNALQNAYPLKTAPALLFYDNDNGRTRLEHALHGGILTLSFLRGRLNTYYGALPGALVD